MVTMVKIEQWMCELHHMMSWTLAIQWFRWWSVTCSAYSHYFNPCWLLFKSIRKTTLTEICSKIRWFSFKDMHLKNRLQNVDHLTSIWRSEIILVCWKMELLAELASVIFHCELGILLSSEARFVCSLVDYRQLLFESTWTIPQSSKLTKFLACKMTVTTHVTWKLPQTISRVSLTSAYGFAKFPIYPLFTSVRF